MRLSGFNHLLFWLKKRLGISDHKSYLLTLIENLERQKEENNALAFRIVSIKNKGFVVKVGGLFAYGSFDHMPWQYPSYEAWRAVFPYLTDRLFYCKIHTIRKEPLFILINGNIPQFKKPQLKQNDLYIGIILNKTNYGLFIDIGFHFGWEYGSLVGMLHISDVAERSLFEKAEAGNSREVLFLGSNDKEQLVFGDKSVPEEWFTGELEKRVGEMVWVKVTKIKGKPPGFQVEGRYDATLPVLKSIYPGRSGKVSQAIRNLEDEEIIRCEIVSVDSRNRSIHLKWVLDWEIDAKLARNYHIGDPNILVDEDRNSVLDKEFEEKHSLIGQRVQVSVRKKGGRFNRVQNQYLIRDRFEGILTISNDSYRISKKEMKQIELNLTEGDVIECEVTGLDRGKLMIKWNVSQDELTNLRI